MRRFIIALLTFCLTIPALAQPPARRQTHQHAAKELENAIPAPSERAPLEFPTQAPMPADVVWRRDIYR